MTLLAASQNTGRHRADSRLHQYRIIKELYDMCRSNGVQGGLITRLFTPMSIIACIMLSLVRAETDCIIRPSMGHAETNLGRHCIYTQDAELHFILNLPEIGNISSDTDVECQSIANGRSEMQACRIMRPLITALHAMRRDASNLTRTELSRIYALMTSFDVSRDNSSRTVRSILSSIGSVVGGVFGWATSERMDHVEKVIKQIYDVTFRAANTLEASGNKVSRLIKAENERLDVMHRLLETEHNASSILFKELNAVSINLELGYQAIGHALRFVTAYIRSLQAITELSDALHQLLRGRLTDLLIAREVFMTELMALKQQLNGLFYLS